METILLRLCLHASEGSLSGTVLEDTDGDGTGDVGIGGVLLTLKDENGNDIDSNPATPDVEPTTTTTASNGVL